VRSRLNRALRVITSAEGHKPTLTKARQNLSPGLMRLRPSASGNIAFIFKRYRCLVRNILLTGLCQANHPIADLRCRMM
jgi:hypothetical protein